jgi:hypothetical protein
VTKETLRYVNPISTAGGGAETALARQGPPDRFGPASPVCNIKRKCQDQAEHDDGQDGFDHLSVLFSVHCPPICLYKFFDQKR